MYYTSLQDVFTNSQTLRCTLAFPKVGKGLKQENCAGITARLGFFLMLLVCWAVYSCLLVFSYFRRTVFSW